MDNRWVIDVLQLVQHSAWTLRRLRRSRREKASSKSHHNMQAKVMWIEDIYEPDIRNKAGCKTRKHVSFIFFIDLTMVVPLIFFLVVTWPLWFWATCVAMGCQCCHGDANVTGYSGASHEEMLKVQPKTGGRSKLHPGKWTFWTPKSWRFGSDHFPFSII